MRSTIGRYLLLLGILHLPLGCGGEIEATGLKAADEPEQARSTSSSGSCVRGLLGDRQFRAGLRASYRFGATFDSRGEVVTWKRPQVFGPSGTYSPTVLLHPRGAAGTTDERGLYWDLEDGEYGGWPCTSDADCNVGDRCIDRVCAVKTPNNVWQREGSHYHRMALFGKTLAFDANRLIVGLDNPFTGRPVKRFHSNRNGYLRMWHNTANEVIAPQLRYGKYGWPHYLLVYRPRLPVDFATYRSQTFWLRARIERARRLDQSPTEMTFQIFWFIEHKSSAKRVFVGTRAFSTNGGYRDILVNEQHGVPVCIADIRGASTFGQPMKVSQWTNIQIDVKKLVHSCLGKLQLDADPNHYVVRFLNLGLEGTGAWEVQAEIAGGAEAINWTGECAVSKPPPQAGLPSTRPVYRYYSPTSHDHFLSLERREFTGYLYEGRPFSVFQAAHTELKPLYRCATSSWDHFTSLSSTCEGQRVEGRYGWIARKALAGASRALYRCYSPVVNDHHATVNKSECAGGYHVESVLGYVP